MAWGCSGDTNDELVRNLCKAGLVSIPAVKDAFLKTDRGHFAPNYPYEDSPQVIGYGATISAPHMHASAMEYLYPSLTRKAKTRILDVGSGSGFLCQVMALIAGQESLCVGVEHIQGLVDLGKENMQKSELGQELLASGRVKFVLGDGRKGWDEPGEEGPGWDVIHVGAAAKGWPKALLDQLKSPGRMFIPVEHAGGSGVFGGRGAQEVYVVDKDEAGKINRKNLFGVRYVPLTDAENQLRS